MMPTILVLVLLGQGPLETSASRAWAHDLAQSAPQCAGCAGQWETRPIRSPTFVWVGIGLVAAGTLAAILAVTTEQHSDLSQEDINVRIGRDLAACGTDPDATNLPIADCTPNYPLLWIGVGMQAAGGSMILYGSRPMTLTPSVAWRVRF